MPTARSIKIKSKDEIDRLKKAGKILATISEELKRSLKIGMTTKDIDRRAEDLIARAKVKPAFKGYHGFPACACVSVNQEVVHGIPGKRVVKEGDIVSIDIGIIHDDYFSDTAFTVGFGKIDPELKRLIDVTGQALLEGIEQAVPGNHLSDISFAVQDYVESNNFSVVRDFVGHGIGRELHEDPEVPNYGLPQTGPILKEGIVLAIEPMVNVGTWRTKILDDGWTVVTQDGKPSAHFEHTVAIMRSGPVILTQ
ncbi:MAG: type I methionyl aminopeptidase [Candidatus Omnitrophota bacterium]